MREHYGGHRLVLLADPGWPRRADPVLVRSRTSDCIGACADATLYDQVDVYWPRVQGPEAAEG